MAARMYTRGWDFFAPPQTVVYHLWSREHRPSFRQVTDEASRQSNRQEGFICFLRQSEKMDRQLFLPSRSGSLLVLPFHLRETCRNLAVVYFYYRFTLVRLAGI